VSDVVICDRTASTLGVVDGLVFIHWVRVAGDDVPGMDEAGEVTEAAEGDIDEGVSGTEADFDPYCWSGMLATWWPRQRNRDVPAIGGKRTAIRARKMSPQDIVAVLLR
jgi:hypothetical protein